MAAHEAVSVQLEIKIKAPRGVEPSQSLMDEFVREWADSGNTPPGVSIRIIEWDNPRGGGKPTSQKEARERFGRLLRRGRATFSVRSN